MLKACLCVLSHPECSGSLLFLFLLPLCSWPSSSSSCLSLFLSSIASCFTSVDRCRVELMFILIWAPLSSSSLLWNVRLNPDQETEGGGRTIVIFQVCQVKLLVECLRTLLVNPVWEKLMGFFLCCTYLFLTDVPCFSPQPLLFTTEISNVSRPSVPQWNVCQVDSQFVIVSEETSLRHHGRTCPFAGGASGRSAASPCHVV